MLICFEHHQFFINKSLWSHGETFWIIWFKTASIIKVILGLRREEINWFKLDRTKVRHKHLSFKEFFSIERKIKTDNFSVIKAEI